MDIQSKLAAQQYLTARPATAPKAQPDGQPGVAFGDAAKGFAETLKMAEETSKAAMVGDADPHALVQALAQTELAVERHVLQQRRDA